MLDRALALSRNPSVQRAADVVLALAIFVGSVADMLTPRAHSGWGGPRGLELLAALLISVPLLWRKRYPIPVLVAVFVGGAIDVLSVAPRQAGFEPFVAEIVAFYSLGAHEDERRSLGAFIAVTVLGMFPSAFLHETVGSVAPALVFTFAAWLVGRIIRSWRNRAVELERANLELEQQRELQAEAAVMVERGRIARELHDVIAHNVSMIVVQAGAAARCSREHSRTCEKRSRRSRARAATPSTRCGGYSESSAPTAVRFSHPSPVSPSSSVSSQTSGRPGCPSRSTWRARPRRCRRRSISRRTGSRRKR